MSIPTNQFVFAGDWSALTLYPQFQFVISPIDGDAYVNVDIQPSLGGPDPSVQPSTVWVRLNQPVGGGGITSLNGLTDPAIDLVSLNGSITYNPIAPNQISLDVFPLPFTPAYGSFSSSATQTLNPAPSITQLFYTNDDIISVNVSSAITSPYLTVVNAGTYKVLSSVQFDKTGTGVGLFAPAEMWIELNDVAVPNSATRLVINNNLEMLMTVEWFVDCDAGDRISIVAYDPTSSGDLVAKAFLATPPCPEIPSIITTILRIA